MFSLGRFGYDTKELRLFLRHSVGQDRERRGSQGSGRDHFLLYLSTWTICILYKLWSMVRGSYDQAFWSKCYDGKVASRWQKRTAVLFWGKTIWIEIKCFNFQGIKKYRSKCYSTEYLCAEIVRNAFRYMTALTFAPQVFLRHVALVCIRYYVLALQGGLYRRPLSK